MPEYIISTAKIRSNAAGEVMKCTSDQLMQVIIKPYKKTRSEAQNSYLWGVVYPAIKEYVFDSTGDNFTTEDIHDWCKDEFIVGDPKIIMSRVIVQRSTKKLKTDQFCTYVARIQHHFAEKGLVIPDPDPFTKGIKHE